MIIKEDLYNGAEKEKALKLTRLNLGKNRELLECVAAVSPNVILVCKVNENFDIDFLSEDIQGISGYSVKEINEKFGGKFINLIVDEDKKRFKNAFINIFDNCVINIEFRIKRKDAEALWVMANLKISQNAEVIFSCFLIDISELKKVENELKISQEQLRNALECDDNIIFEYDIANNYLNFSQKSLPKSMQNSAISGNLDGFLAKKIVDDPSAKAILNMIEQIKLGQNASKCEILCRESENSAYEWFEISLSTVYDNNIPIKAIGFARNINCIKNETLKFKKLAELDPLTGIYNKVSIQEAVKKILKHKRNCALIMLDVDNFKEINDFFGHSVGDEVIKEIASRLNEIKDDNTLVGRMGGDEFVIFCNDITDDEILKKLRNLREKLLKFKTAKNKEITVKLSGGIAKTPKDGDNFEKLFHNADMALYYAKRIGGNDFCFYNTSIGRSYKTFVKRIEENKINNFGIAGDDNKLFKSSKILLSAIIVLTLAVSIVMTISLRFYKTALRKEAMQSLLETSNQISDRVKVEFKNRSKNLDNVGVFLLESKISDIDGLYEFLNERASDNGFEYLAAVSKNYADNVFISYNSFGTAEVLSGASQSTADEWTANNKKNILKTEEIDGETYICYSIPFDQTVAGQNIKFLAGYVNIKTLYGFLDTGAYDGACFSHIINKSGDSVVISQNTYSIKNHFNIINLLNNSSKNQSEVNSIINDLKTDKEGYMSFSRDANEKYAAYSPLNINDWILLTVVDEIKIFHMSKNLYYTAAIIMISVIIVSLSLLIAYLVFDFGNKKTLKKLAYYDVLTESPKLNLFASHIEGINEKDKKQYAVVYTNVVNFKLINDRYGANIGDMVLLEISKTIRNNLRDGEYYGRLNADHFGILIKIGEMGEAEKRLLNIAEELNKKHFGNNQVSVKMMFGVYCLNTEDKNALNIIDNAIIALKLSNKTETVNHYSKEIKNKLINDKHLEDKMRDALKNECFEVYLQPKVDIMSDTYMGAEALIRWNDPELGLIYPSMFIPLFERNGFIADIDLFVFEKVCQILNKWQNEGKKLIPISFNFSKAHFFRKNYIEPFVEILNKYDIQSKYIEFEFTETMANENLNEMAALIEMLHQKGFTCALDDFGSGSSSLSVLKDIAVDVIKIDKNFFSSIRGNESRYQNVVKGVVKIAKDLEIETVAEGIEDKKQISFLRSIGCNTVQGFFYSKPMRIKEFENKIYGV